MQTLNPTTIDLHGPTESPQDRAACMAMLSQELANAVGRMWRFYDVNPQMNDEQPAEETEHCFAGSLDDWWHELIGLRDAWAAKAGVQPDEVFDAYAGRNA